LGEGGNLMDSLPPIQEVVVRDDANLDDESSKDLLEPSQLTVTLNTRCVTVIVVVNGKREKETCEALQQRSTSHKHCKFEGCNKFRRGCLGGYCATHPAQSKPRPSRLCLFEKCSRYRRTGLNGYCNTHKSLGSHTNKTMKQPRSPTRCKYDGCTKYRQTRMGGLCRRHRLWLPAYEKERLNLRSILA
jgi:hypothetical protein